MQDYIYYKNKDRGISAVVTIPSSKPIGGNDNDKSDFSRIQDFNYAKTALSINAAGYILKPIQIKEIIEVLKKYGTASIWSKTVNKFTKDWRSSYLTICIL
jgi:hypothetical protein